MCPAPPVDAESLRARIECFEGMAMLLSPEGECCAYSRAWHAVWPDAPLGATPLRIPDESGRLMQDKLERACAFAREREEPSHLTYFCPANGQDNFWDIAFLPTALSGWTIALHRPLLSRATPRHFRPSHSSRRPVRCPYCYRVRNASSDRSPEWLSCSDCQEALASPIQPANALTGYCWDASEPLLEQMARLPRQNHLAMSYLTHAGCNQCGRAILCIDVHQTNEACLASAVCQSGHSNEWHLSAPSESDDSCPNCGGVMWPTGTWKVQANRRQLQNECEDCFFTVRTVIEGAFVRSKAAPRIRVPLLP